MHVKWGPNDCYISQQFHILQTFQLDFILLFPPNILQGLGINGTVCFEVPLEIRHYRQLNLQVLDPPRPPEKKDEKNTTAINYGNLWAFCWFK